MVPDGSEMSLKVRRGPWRVQKGPEGSRRVREGLEVWKGLGGSRRFREGPEGSGRVQKGLGGSKREQEGMDVLSGP